MESRTAELLRTLNIGKMPMEQTDRFGWIRRRYPATTPVGSNAPGSLSVRADRSF